MTWIGFILGFGSLQGSILAIVLLITRAQKPAANRIMAALLFLLSFQLLHIWAVIGSVYLDYPWASLWIGSGRLAWGPLLFLYALRLTSARLSAWHLLHFVPVLIMLLPNVHFLSLDRSDQILALQYFRYKELDVSDEQVELLIQPIWKVIIDYHLQGSFFALQFSIYCALVLRLIRHLRAKLEDHYSSTDHLDLKWLRTLCRFCLLFILMYLVFNRSQVYFSGEVSIFNTWAVLPFLFLVVAIYAIGFLAFYQPSIIGRIEAALPEKNAQQEAEVQHVVERVEPEQQPQTAPHDDGEMAVSIRRLNEAMTEDQLYLDSELTMPLLAKHVSLAPHRVSKILNGEMNNSFFNFVNAYRLALAKQLMADPATEKMPIVELALEVGFKSKSSFYDAFKKNMHMTPTQYKKSLQ